MLTGRSAALLQLHILRRWWSPGHRTRGMRPHAPAGREAVLSSCRCRPSITMCHSSLSTLMKFRTLKWQVQQLVWEFKVHNFIFNFLIPPSPSIFQWEGEQKEPHLAHMSMPRSLAKIQVALWNHFGKARKEGTRDKTWVPLELQQNKWTLCHAVSQTRTDNFRRHKSDCKCSLSVGRP